MTYLSRLIFNLRDRHAQHDLADCQELHRSILAGFPDVADTTARSALGILYRVEASGQRPQILVQSAVRPNWSGRHPGYLAEKPESRQIDGVYAALDNGQRLRFRLRANATKRVLREEGWAGKRVNLQREEDQLAWLQRKGSAGGFDLVQVRCTGGVPSVQVAPQPAEHGRRDERRLTFGAVLFDGELRITDVDVFRAALRNGIGSGKAYGFGLLSIGTAG